MLNKISVILLIILFAIYSVIVLFTNKSLFVKEVILANKVRLSNGQIYTIPDTESFEPHFNKNNKDLALKLGISESEAFVIGNLGLYWASDILDNRRIKFVNNDLIYDRFSYNIKFLNSPFCIKNGKAANEQAFNKLLKSIRSGKYGIIKEDKYYPISSIFDKGEFILMRRDHYNLIFKDFGLKNKNYPKKFSDSIYLKNMKLIISDFTFKYKPDRSCSETICREILRHINSANSTIDIAIYGYSSTPAIENALINAKNRGVQIRLVYDVDSTNKNIYPDTFKFVELFPASKSDKESKMVNNIMHNKFYIFDKQIVITGSANLSHTDMSGYNANNIIVFNSSEIAKIYEAEFNQMFEGKFHNEKRPILNKNFRNVKIYFSPQDKALNNAVIPLIRQAANYIYIPAFFITDKAMVEELINAKRRGVEIKIILDALSAASKYSQHERLRQEGILVKTENYAGKLHTKTMVIDDEYLVLGSMNFSNSGNNKNDENLIILKDSKASVFYKQFFIYLWNRIPDKWLKYNARAESKDSAGSCLDGLDNDYDGLIDMEDEGCKF